MCLFVSISIILFIRWPNCSRFYFHVSTQDINLDSHQSATADAAFPGLRTTLRRRAATPPAVRQRRIHRRARRAGRPRTCRRWLSSSISTTTSINTRTPTNTSRPSCTPRPRRRRWWAGLCCSSEHLCCDFQRAWNVDCSQFERFLSHTIVLCFSVWEVSKQNGRTVPTPRKCLFNNPADCVTSDNSNVLERVVLGS